MKHPLFPSCVLLLASGAARWKMFRRIIEHELEESRPIDPLADYWEYHDEPVSQWRGRKDRSHRRRTD